jgi:hypothetical protein
VEHPSQWAPTLPAITLSINPAGQVLVAAADTTSTVNIPPWQKTFAIAGSIVATPFNNGFALAGSSQTLLP